MKKSLGRIAVVVVLALGGCDPGDGGDDAGEMADAGTADAAMTDGGGADVDAGPTGRDSGPGGGMDSSVLPDAGPMADAGPIPTTIRGELTGVVESVAVQLDGAEVLVLPEDGAFAFTAETTVGAPYEVTIAGFSNEDYCVLEGASGDAPAEGEIAVRVRCEPGDRLKADERCFGEDGEETERTRRTAVRAADGSWVITHLVSTGPGTDGVWFTNDDDSLFGIVREFDAGSDRPSLTIRSAGIGGDDTLGTADDEVTGTVLETFDGELVALSARSMMPGPDGVWATDDDLLEASSYRQAITKDAMGRVTCRGRYAPGPDQLLGTADDEPGQGREIVYDTDAAIDNAARVTESFISDMGPDGLPCTADDVVSNRIREWFDNEGRRWLNIGNVDSAPFYFEVRYDAQDRVIAEIDWNLVDGVVDGPGRGNDTFNRLRETAYDAEGREVFVGTSVDPGDDGVPLTPDDVFQNNARSFVHDADGNVVVEYRYAGGALPLGGPDGVRGTPDDPAARMIVSRYAFGERTCAATIDDPGANGLWDARDCGNGHRDGGAAHDDNVGNAIWAEVDARGRAVRFGSSRAPGADGLWGNADDELSGGAGFIRDVDAERWARIQIANFGTDALPFTTDDELQGRASLRGEDESGFVTFSGSVSAPGTDGIHFTGDDVGVSYGVFERDASGGIVSEVYYGFVGPDGDWFTADDVPECRSVFEAVPQRPGEG